jgi:membrane protein
MSLTLKELNITKNLWLALKQFFKEEGLDKISILAYYSIFSTLFLLTFFTFLFAKSLGDPDIALKGIYPLSTEFFSKISPDILERAAVIANKLEEIGIFGITASLFLGFLVIMKIVQYVNAMFHVNLKAKKSEKGFWVRRVSEFSLLLLIGFIMIVSFIITGIIGAAIALFQKSEFLAGHINPGFIDTINTFLLKYALPFLITFIFFFILYKWIPEKVVYLKGSFIAAIICTILWETLKRLYTFYMIKISIFGKIQGPIIAVILFGFWMELSMGIMLYGAKLTYIFDQEKEKHDQLKRDNPDD